MVKQEFISVSILRGNDLIGRIGGEEFSNS